MVASLRKSDSIAEQALGAFLDEHFYETLHKRDAGFEYERVHDRVVPEKLRTLDHGRPWSDDQFASTRLSSNRDMSR